LREAAVARFEELRQVLAPGQWSVMSSQVDMSLLPPDLSTERSHEELKSRRSAQRRAMKADKGIWQDPASLQRKQEWLLRRVGLIVATNRIHDAVDCTDRHL
jgi:hypothetical protein